jgi:mRNA interferase MazF
VNALPERGALVWVDFTPQSGREQAGHRPALVMSPRIYHERSKLAVVCPITSNTRPWPWKVMLPDGLAVSGAVLVDQVRSVDRIARRLRLAGDAPQTVVAEVQARLAALLGMQN